MKAKSLFCILLLTFDLAQASEMEISCFPKSNLKFYKENKSLTGISEREFNVLGERFKKTFDKVVQQQLNKELVLNLKWSDPTVDANATRDEKNNPVLNINGGIARHPLMTRDGLLLIMCHELGHHLGGAPKIFRGNSNLRGWSSAEGEADYFASSKCLSKLFQDELDNKNLDSEIDTPALKSAMVKCHDDLCTRVVIASKTVSDVFASLKTGSITPNILGKDLSVATKTIYTHPSPQCRLDTFIAGVKCDVNSEMAIDNTDPKIGACLSNSNSEGARPACWFQENDF